MITNKDEYFKFRDEVLSKTTGANIHAVRGKLGGIINRLVAYEDPSEYWDKHRENYKKRY